MIGQQSDQRQVSLQDLAPNSTLPGHDSFGSLIPVWMSSPQNLLPIRRYSSLVHPDIVADAVSTYPMAVDPSAEQIPVGSGCGIREEGLLPQPPGDEI